MNLYLATAPHHTMVCIAAMTATRSLSTALLPLLCALTCPRSVLAQSSADCLGEVALHKTKLLCLRGFYTGLRTHPSRDCRLTFLTSYPSCVERSIMDCVVTNFLPVPSKLDLHKLAGAYENTSDLTSFCDFISPITLEPFNSHCSQRYRVESVRCSTPLNVKFAVNKGDSGLCRAYDTMVRCALDVATTHCDPGDVEQFRITYPFVTQHEFNPFCSSAQAVSGSNGLDGLPFVLLVAPLLFLLIL